ncbi:MAG TPA: diguanylate cyclase [Solirubrobacteraceae bacterium]|nr:diguanylate cyclase [Solirubrobacteraceae bacterium]
MTRRDPRFRKLARPARALTVSALVAAAVATLLLQPAEPVGSTDLTLLALTAALCALASFFEVSSPGSTSLHPGLVFVFWAAVLLPPFALPLLAVLCFLPSALRRRVRWYVPAFHAAACVLAGLAAHGLLHAVGVPDERLTGTGTAVALGFTAVAFVLIIDALIALHMRLAWHRPLRVAARGLAVNLPVDVALTTTGAALAAMWSFDPWLCAILAGPMGLVTRAMLVPALRHKSRTDPKTGLFNFEHLRESLDDALRTATRRDDAVALVMIDLDHLRTINNRFGHLAGDQAIMRVAEGLARAAHERGIAARFGGEEFCLLLPDWTAAQAEALVEGVRAEVQDLGWEADGETMRCSFSAGVAMFPKDAEDADALLNAADAALYDAKAGGRNRVRLALPADALASMESGPWSRTTPAAAFTPAPALAAAAPPPADLPPAVEDEIEAERVAEAPAKRYIPAFVSLLLVAVIGVLVVSGPIDSMDSPALLLMLVAAVVLLDVVRIDLFEGLNLSAASVPTLTLACVFGPVGPIAGEVAIAMVRLARGEPRLKWSFDLGALGLAGSVAAVVFTAMPTETPLQQIFAGIPAALAYYVVNTTLMSIVIAMAEGRRPFAVWREGMAWLWAHFVVYGVIGAALAVSYEQLGPVTVLLFALPVATLWLGQRGYVHRSRASVVELRRHRDDLEIANRRLRRLLDEKRDLVGRMHGSYLSTITSLARTIEAKDPYTGGHVERVAKVTMLLAGELGLPETQLRAAEVGATIHDIGKIGVPDSILLKPARLSDHELAIMRRHPETSSYIVGELDVPRIVKEMVRSHHERYDGTGYPDRLAGEEIPLSARILAVADTLDAITSERPYREARTLAAAIDEIRTLTGKQFCPSVVAALEACLERDASLGGLFEARRGRFPASPASMAAPAA